MQCFNPIKAERQVNGSVFSYQHRCGGCPGCLINNAATWAGRILLESRAHQSSVFITLTYADDLYPADGSVSKRHLQLFLKRLRMRLVRANYGPKPFRYYAVGEYGERTGRAHYHAVLFGVDTSITEHVEAAWNYQDPRHPEDSTGGWISVYPLLPERARYVARYTTKKLTAMSLSQDGRAREFAIMSKRPGLGSWFTQSAAASLLRYSSRVLSYRSTERTANQSNPIWHGYMLLEGKYYPVGRYLRTKFRSLVRAILGPQTSTVPLIGNVSLSEIQAALWEEIQTMIEAYQSLPESVKASKMRRSKNLAAKIMKPRGEI